MAEEKTVQLRFVEAVIQTAKGEKTVVLARELNTGKTYVNFREPTAIELAKRADALICVLGFCGKDEFFVELAFAEKLAQELDDHEARITCRALMNSLKQILIEEGAH